MRRTLMLVCAVLLLFSGCSGGGGGSDQSGTTSVVVDGGDGPVTVSLPANLYLMPGVGGNGEPDLAPVLQAKMIAVEPETAVAAFVVHEPVMTVEGSGYMWRWSSGDMSESLNLALGGNYGEEGRPLIGVLNYALEHTDVYIGSLALNLGHDLSTISDKYGRLNAESYEGAEDFEDMTAAEARALVEPRFIALGAAPKSLKLYKTLRLTKEQQER